MWLVAVSLCALAGDPPRLRLDMLAGRVRAAHSGGVETLASGASDWTHGASGYLESSTLSRLRMRWLGSASLDIEGALALSWRPSREEGRGLTLDFGRLERAELEVREGPLRFELASGWRGLCPRGALALRAGTGDVIELELRSGAPLLLSPPSCVGAVRPPWTVLPGARVRLLGSDPRPRITAGKLRSPEGVPWTPGLQAPVRERPWRGFHWPWPAPAANAVRGWGPGW
ncbi:MAG: hypothetical protein FJ294_01805 [Planctomycetes bacterium]|nr:hypothetical protein [Planctomycetota bacterium]